jgi:hypothetical protein
MPQIILPTDQRDGVTAIGTNILLNKMLTELYASPVYASPISNYVGAFTYATLPAATSVPAGSMAYTTDLLSYWYATPAGWVQFSSISSADIADAMGYVGARGAAARALVPVTTTAGSTSATIVTIANLSIGANIIIAGAGAPGLDAAAIAAAGSGYALLDTLTLMTGSVVAGTFSVAAVIQVTGVDGGGAVTNCAVTLPGVYSVIPTGNISTSGGSGSGFTCTGTFRAAPLQTTIADLPGGSSVTLGTAALSSVNTTTTVCFL